MFSLGQAAKQCGVAKATISKAIATGKLSATRREDQSWAIDPAELARYLEANGHRFRPLTGSSGQPETEGENIPELRARAQLAEERLADLKAQLADMRDQRDRWMTQAERVTLPGQQPRRWWPWRRAG
jgi:hypothetical protein